MVNPFEGKETTTVVNAFLIVVYVYSLYKNVKYQDVGFNWTRKYILNGF